MKFFTLLEGMLDNNFKVKTDPGKLEQVCQDCRDKMHEDIMSIVNKNNDQLYVEDNQKPTPVALPPPELDGEDGHVLAGDERERKVFGRIAKDIGSG